ncbi:MAG: hypothetical protein HY066_14855 [Betaproteobacteria bacterium]|nr:hypothetical protein [Betaproteobacteria bacterium]
MKAPAYPALYLMPKLPAALQRYLPLLIGCLAVILLGSSGIAAVMDRAPGATDPAGVVPALGQIGTFGVSPVAPDETQAPGLSARAAHGAHVKARCTECGVFTSSRVIEPAGAGVERGMTGGLVRDARNGTPGKTAKRYEITLRMRNGSSRVFMDTTPAHWRAGERVILIEGASQSND